MPKLTNPQTNALLREIQSGVPYSALAKRYRIDPSYCSVIARRKGLPPRTEATKQLNHEIARLRRDEEKRAVGGLFTALAWMCFALSNTAP